MNIRDLRYLAALAKYHHFGKAAEASFVSQPALSMQIKKLEATLGVTLLERTNKFVRLTDIGKTIASQAEHILQQVDALHDIAKSAIDPFAGNIKLGIFPTLAPYLLPIIMPLLTKAFPKLTFFLVEDKTDSLLAQLKEGALQAAFIALPVNDPALTENVLFHEEFLLAVAKQHALAQHNIVKDTDFQQEHLLLLEEGHCLREQALAVCQRLKTTENQDFRATSLETLRHMVAAGVGITLIPKLACTPHKNIRYIPLMALKPMRTIALVFRKSSTKQTVLHAITQHIQANLPQTLSRA